MFEVFLLVLVFLVVLVFVVFVVVVLEVLLDGVHAILTACKSVNEKGADSLIAKGIGAGGWTCK